MSTQAAGPGPLTFSGIRFGSTFETFAAGFAGIFIIACFHSFTYLLWIPVIAPIHFLRSAKSMELGLEWFRHGIHGEAGNAIERFVGKTNFAVYLGFIAYAATSLLYVIYFTPYALTPHGFWLEMLLAGLLGFMQIILCSAVVGTLSIVLTGLGRGGNDPAGGIEVAVNGTFRCAWMVVVVSLAGGCVVLLSTLSRALFASYAIGMAVAAWIGAMAALGIVRVVKSNFDAFSSEGYTSGASAIYEATKGLSDRDVKSRAISGGALYLPGLPVAFFCAAFIIRFFSSVLKIWSCILEMPKNMAQLYFSTPLRQLPELIPNIPIDHDIKMGNVLMVARAAWAKRNLANRIFAGFWTAMLGGWFIGGYGYRFYLKSSFFFMIPLLPIYERKVSVNPLGIRGDWRRFTAWYAIISALVAFTIFVLPYPSEAYENGHSFNTLPTILVLLGFAWHRYGDLMSWLTILSAGSGLYYLRTRWYLVRELVDPNVEFVDIKSARESDNTRLARLATDHWRATVMRCFFSKTFWTFNFLYIALYALHLQGWLHVDSEWITTFRKIYGDFANALLDPSSPEPLQSAVGSMLGSFCIFFCGA